MFTYSKEEMDKAADDMDFLRSKEVNRHTLPGMMNDYKLTRNSIRKCKNG